MPAFAIVVFLTLAFHALSIHIYGKDIEKLKKQVLDLNSQLRRRQAGQSWQEIKKASEDEELIQRYLGTPLWP